MKKMVIYVLTVVLILVISAVCIVFAQDNDAVNIDIFEE